MNICKTCVYWTLPKAGRSAEVGMCEPLDPDTYKPMEREFEVRICKHPKQTFCEAPIEANGFGVADGSNYMAMLVTGQDFGCVRHSSY